MKRAAGMDPEHLILRSRRQNPKCSLCKGAPEIVQHVVEGNKMQAVTCKLRSLSAWNITILGGQGIRSISRLILLSADPLRSRYNGLSACLAAPYSTSFVQNIHHPSSAHVQTILCLSNFIYKLLSQSCPSDLLLSNLVSSGLSQWWS